MLIIGLLIMTIVGVLHAGLFSMFVPCDGWTFAAISAVCALWYFRPMFMNSAKEKVDGRTEVEED